MKFTHYIYIITTLAILTACSDDITTPTYTEGEADNAIVLSAGIDESGSAVQTRAAGSIAIDDASTKHGKHLAFTTGTKAALRIDGTWLGHGDGSVSRPTTATIGAETATGSKHNSLTMSPQLYWDDFGTSDPANMPSVANNGRAKGLTIYGAAANGVTTAPSIDGSDGKKWTALSWNVGTVETVTNVKTLGVQINSWNVNTTWEEGPVNVDGVIDQTSGWSTYDLLTTNNVRTDGPDGTYKFDEKASGKLLEFTHAMTKVTVNLTAGAGFAGSKFVNQPSVTLLGFNYTGTVNIEEKTSTPTENATANIKAYMNDGATWTSASTAQATALVFPDNKFGDATDILKIEADGNIYYVNATKINVANNVTGDVFEQAKNYIFNIIVNKTSIDVTATIKDWGNVEATSEMPIIGFSRCYGQEGTDFAKGFTFYRSTAINGSFLSGLTEGNNASVSYDATNGYSMAPQLYWPNHSTHYFFRAIWPVVDSKDSGNAQLGPTTTQVKDNSIDVANCAYKQGYYPSDLMIGMPRKTDGTSDEECKAGHKDASNNTVKGVCATDAASGSTHENEGLTHMNFQYAMSQVIVELTTSTGEDAVTFDEHTTVEIVDGYTQGTIQLGTQASDFTGKSVGNYTMNKPETNDYTKFHDAIIPQSLSNGTGSNIKNLKFRITVGNDSDKEVYETVLGIKSIKVTEGGVVKDITSWSPGKKYTYKLHITKTNINVVATLSDWITATAEENIWF